LKHLGRYIILTAILCLALSASAHQIPRIVLLETFTNVSCAGCSTANLVTDQVCNTLGNNAVLNVQFHLNWPESADPFFMANQTDNFIRGLYYDVSSAPDLRTNGSDMPDPGDETALIAAITEHHDRLSPLSLEISHTYDGANLTADVGVKAVATPPSGELRLFVAVVDELEHYATPPGDNGETDFHWSMRTVLPNFNGEPFTIGEGDSLTFTLPTAMAAEWQDSDLQVVAWVQDYDTFEILQAATTAPAADYAADYYAESYGRVGEVDELHRFDGWLVNRGTQTDTYDFVITADTPGWEVSACAGLVCYPPWITTFDVTLAPGEEILIAADVKPLTAAASGSVTMTCTSSNDRDVEISRTFVLFTPGLDVMYVSDDDAYDAYFTDAMTAAGRTWAGWNLTALGRPSLDDLGTFSKVVWNTEGAVPGLDEDARGRISAYLDDGGDLMLSGQDLAYSLCDPLSPSFTQLTHLWFQDYTGVVYVADDAQDSSITGVAGDPVGQGLTFSLAGGDGAGNQDYPDVLSPVSNARTILEYSPGNGAGVRFAKGDARMVTLGFGFEGIGAGAMRNNLMAAVLDWFDDTTVSVPGHDVPAPRLAAVAAHPNPFNPATEIVFALAGDGLVDTRLDIYDVSGRRVRRLFAGSLPAGDHRLGWDGRDDAGAAVAGGMYLAILRAGDETRTLKMSLVK
jgi:hypothetical protein